MSRSSPPKRPMSAYFLFLNEIRPELVKEHPSVGVAEISKLAGERWRQVDSVTKKQYQEQFEEAKVKYDKTKAEYEAKYGPIKNSRKKKQQQNSKTSKRNK